MWNLSCDKQDWCGWLITDAVLSSADFFPTIPPLQWLIEIRRIHTESVVVPTKEET